MKKKISAEIIADSKNEAGDRITTFVLTFPRIILAELNTHRVFSRNSASSRAIPFKRMLEMVTNDPFIPIAFQKDHKGMQGTEYFTKDDGKTELVGGGFHSDLDKVTSNWLTGRDFAVKSAEAASEMGVTKQLCNRRLETYMWHTAIVTATEFENYFKQRCPQYTVVIDGEEVYYRSKRDMIEEFPDLKHEDEMFWFHNNKGQGEIHIMELAEQMWDQLNQNTPNELRAGEWHIPFGDKFSDEILGKLGNLIYGVQPSNYTPNFIQIQEMKVKIATARCARISYLNFDGTDDYEKDIELHDRLASMYHWSPFEHCAKTMSEKEYDRDLTSRNFTGFVQYRDLVEK